MKRRHERCGGPPVIDIEAIVMRTVSSRFESGIAEECPGCHEVRRLDHVIEIRPGIFVCCCRNCREAERVA